MMLARAQAASDKARPAAVDHNALCPDESEQNLGGENDVHVVHIAYTAAAPHGLSRSGEYRREGIGRTEREAARAVH
jgi:hypothetical protein